MTAEGGVVADGANPPRRFAVVYAGLAIVVIVAVTFLVNTVRTYDRASRQEDELWHPGQVAGAICSPTQSTKRRDSGAIS